MCLLDRRLSSANEMSVGELPISQISFFRVIIYIAIYVKMGYMGYINTVDMPHHYIIWVAIMYLIFT